MQCLPFFVLLLDPANTGGLARRCCTSILSLQTKRELLIIDIMRKYIAECIGTMVLTLLGCGTAMLLGCNTAAGVVGTAVAFGLSVVAMAYTIGGISGCHINPARSIGPALFAGGQALKDLWVFIVAPLCGGALSAVVWSALAPAADEK